jgi:capsular exopolysaccharide synthesis family protein
MRTAKLEKAIHEGREKDSANVTVPDAAIEAELKRDVVASRFLQEISQHEVEIATWKQRSTMPDAEPGYQKAVQLLNSAKTGLTKRREQLRPTLVQQLRDKVRDDQQLMRLQFEDRIKFLTEIETQLTAELKTFSKDLTTQRQDNLDVEWLQDEIAQLDFVNKEVTRQMTALKMEIQAPARVTELEEATVVPAQTLANRLRLAGGAAIGAFAAALFGVAFLEFRSRRVNCTDDVVQGLKMKLVGSLPLVPRRALVGRSSVEQNAQWHNRLTESVDAIRTTLLNAARFEGLRVVMVTSAMGGEGKTLLSCHLAVSLARAGCKTLLVDGDLRRPSVHKLFNLPLGQGLSELLRGEVEPAAVAATGPLDGLSVITAGQSDSQAVQNLARTRIADVLRKFSDAYEFVVIDSAPVLPIADAQLIGQHVDGVVFSVMRDVSRLPSVYAACERLALLRVRILGAVVNGIQDNAYHSLYQYAAKAPAQAATPTPAADSQTKPATV